MSLLDQIPKQLTSKLRIEYVQDCGNQFYSFTTTEKFQGILHKTQNQTFQLILPALYDSAHFNAKNNIITAVKYPNHKYSGGKNDYYFYDLKGNLISGFQEIDYINFDQKENIIISKNKKYGVLNDQLEQVIDCKYTKLKSIKKNLFKAQIVVPVDKNSYPNHYSRIFNGIISSDNTSPIIFPPSTDIAELIFQDFILIHEKPHYYSFNLNSLEKQKLPFQQIVKSEQERLSDSTPIFKSITNLDDPYRFQDKFADHLYYDFYEFEPFVGKWGIISAKGETIIPNHYDYVEVLPNDFFRVAMGEFIFEEDEENEILYLKGMKWGIINQKNKIIVPIEFEWAGIYKNNTKAFGVRGGILTKNEKEHKPEWWIEGGEEIIIELG